MQDMHPGMQVQWFQDLLGVLRRPVLDRSLRQACSRVACGSPSVRRWGREASTFRDSPTWSTWTCRPTHPIMYTARVGAGGRGPCVTGGRAGRHTHHCHRTHGQRSSEERKRSGLTYRRARSLIYKVDPVTRHITQILQKDTPNIL